MMASSENVTCKGPVTRHVMTNITNRLKMSDSVIYLHFHIETPSKASDELNPREKAKFN